MKPLWCEPLIRTGLVVVLLLGAALRAFGFSMGYHYDLIREALRREGFGRDAVCLALSANSYADLFQEEAVEWVIDGDFCEVSKLLVEFLHFDGLPDRDSVERYWQQLIENTHIALSERVRANDPLGTLMVIGITLHVLQDFYAHSNWVELDIPRRAKVKDATYFDIAPDQLETLLRGSSVWGKSGLFTHWGGGLSHDALHKDHAGKPYFDQAYRCAYKASLQWLRLVRKWIVEDLRRPDFWNSLQRYQFTGNRSHLYTLTNFDEGTIRWLCTYGGAWKTPRRWSRSDMIADDMPNVPGIGVTEQNFPDYPFLGIEWFGSCALVARDMFEYRLQPGMGRYACVKLLRVEKLEEATRGKNNFGGIVRVIHATVATPPGGWDSPVVRDAKAFLARCTQSDYPRVRWLRVRIPEAMDLDTGAGWNNVNNEEVGGTSDYWVMFIVNGEAEYPYTEAEYVDTSHPYPVWGVLKPLWDDAPVRLQVRLFESDPTNHKDEEMDIAPGSPRAFLFEFDPVSASTSALTGYQTWRIPGGYFIKSEGTGDLRARVYVRIWLMEDFPQPPAYPVLYADLNYDGLPLPVLYDKRWLRDNRFNDRVSSLWIPPSGWALNLYEHGDFRGAVLRATGPEAYLGKIGWNDRASSVQVQQRPRSFPRSIVLREERDYKGAALHLFDSSPTLSTCGFYAELSEFGFDDKASSIEIPTGWTVEVWEKPHFEGASARFTSSVADLHVVGWGKRISSVRIAEQTEDSEREAILAALREALQRFPDEDPMGLGFRYQRPDVRLPADAQPTLQVNHLGIKDGWAWVEVEGEDYVLEVAALLRHEGGRWRVKGIVNPVYAVCSDAVACRDVMAFLYGAFQAKAPEAPREIFPIVPPERNAALGVLQHAIPLERVILLVRKFEVHGEEVRLTVHPRSLDGGGQYEPVSAILQKEGNGWRVKELSNAEDEGEE